jgi:hypothetical protein
MVWSALSRRTLASVVPNTAIAGMWPCSAGIRRERVEAPGGGRPYDLDGCGRLGRQDERTQVVLRYIPRSLVSAPAVDHSRPGGDGLPQGGETTSRRGNQENGWVNFKLAKWVKSRLALTHAKDIVFYQEQPFVIPYQLDGLARNYYPDLFFAFEDGRGVVVEIKPRYQMALYENLIKWSALYKFCALKGWGMLVTDGKRPFQNLQYHELPTGFESTLLRTLANSDTGFLSWKEYREIRDQYNATWIDFVAVILKNRLIWNLQPFVLKRRGS